MKGPHSRLFPRFRVIVLGFVFGVFYGFDPMAFIAMKNHLGTCSFHRTCKSKSSYI